MPALRHSISQLFAPHPAFALRTPQLHEQSRYTAPSVTPTSEEMISSLQPKIPTVPTPSASSAPPSNPHPPTSSISTPTDQTPLSFSSPSPSPSFSALTFPASTLPRTQIEALPPHTTPTSISTPITTTTTPSSTTFPASSPFLYISHKNGKFILDSAKRHPVFFTDKLRKAPAGVGANGYGYEDWKTGSPVARGYVYESGGVEEREAKL
ncbi:hypothetical protein OCU04_003367 [Sclerotinia nivalis]|uniref:Uncharacterized protein n=1 Tax=Sclerotinia nivalis TaxID=352851 RepID=A0A9X0ART6_9HELO|nr:hypothetical protein OCU04_003367 [Sclerotinia nivalis]